MAFYGTGRQPPGPGRERSTRRTTRLSSGRLLARKLQATEYYPIEEERPQGKLQRHAGIGYEIVQNFDVPVPQMVEQLPNIVQFFAALSLVPEQVIDVPKILPHDVPMRRSCREPQLVEQLVEVPTIVPFSSLQRTVEQNVDIPVVGGSGGGGGLSGFLPGQHFSVTAEPIVDNPVPRPGVGRSRQGPHRGQSLTAFLEQIAESPDPGGVLQDFQPVQSSAASSSVSPGHAGQGFFGLFPDTKKVRRSPARWMKKCLGTSAHPRQRLVRFIMSCEMTSGYRS